MRHRIHRAPGRAAGRAPAEHVFAPPKARLGPVIRTVGLARAWAWAWAWAAVALANPARNTARRRGLEGRAASA